MENNLKYSIAEGAPHQKEAWDNICLKNGNLVQSTNFDGVQEFYSQVPLYIEVTHNEKLVGGVKFYFWQSQRNFISKVLSRQITQFGEFVYLSQDFIDPVKDVLMRSLSELLARQKAVFYHAKSFYGKSELILFPKAHIPYRISYHKVAYVDLTLSEEILWSNLHSKNRNSIRKALKEEAKVFSQTKDFSKFIALLTVTYKGNEKKMPNLLFLEFTWKKLIEKNISTIYYSGHGQEALSAAFLYEFGSSAYYAFGGGKKDPRGFGNYLHWEIIKSLKAKGFKYYFLGETAIKYDENNIKFTRGITNFKKGFGVIEHDGIKAEFYLLPLKARFWKLILFLLNDLLSK